MNKFLSISFVFAVAFSQAADGCTDPSYTYDHSGVGNANEERGIAAATTAKIGFCRVVDDYNSLYN